MKNLLLTGVLLPAILTLGGCVVLHSQIDINADGSGTAELSVSMSETVQQCLVEMKDMDTGQAGEMDFPLFEDMERSRIEKAAAGHGVKIEKFAKSTKEGREALDLKVTFKDLEGLSYVMSRVMGDNDSGDGLGIFDAGDGNLVLRATSYDFPAEPKEEETGADAESAAPGEMTPDQMARQMEIMGKMMSAMAELDVSLKITVPGDIVESSAPRTEGRTSIWTINAGNMMTANQDMEPEIVFAGKGLSIKPRKE